MLLLTALLLTTVTPPNLPHEQEVGQLSHALGHLLAHNIETTGMPLNVEELLLGLQEAKEGKASPIPYEELAAKIAQIQESYRNRLAKENLELAEEFLAANAREEGMVVLEEGKLQYQVTCAGDGPIVLSDSTPLIRLKGQFLNGSKLSPSGEELRLYMDEVIPGLKIGILGMHEGEKRTLFLHPSLAYGTESVAPPNALLTMEVEIVKASAPPQDAIKGPTQEIAHARGSLILR